MKLYYCKDCKWWKKRKGEFERANIKLCVWGTCHRAPPDDGADKFFSFPIVEEDDFCGAIDVKPELREDMSREGGQ